MRRVQVMEDAQKEAGAELTFADALSSLPIGGHASVSEASDDNIWYSNQSGSTFFSLSKPVAVFYCEHCSGNRRFFGENEYGRSAHKKASSLCCFRYTCRDCRVYQRVLVLLVCATEEVGVADIWKISEWPRHGEPIDGMVLGALGETWAPLFEKGVKAENMGLGAGAFTYYRAVVEDGFKSLLEKVEVVLVNEGADVEHLEGIRKAAKEKQFSKAVSIAKPHLPTSLMISGHNPLTLLHDLLSYDLHAADDKGALEKATDVRELLTHLTRSIQQSMDANEMAKKSLGRLLKAQQEIRSKS